MTTCFVGGGGYQRRFALANLLWYPYLIPEMTCHSERSEESPSPLYYLTSFIPFWIIRQIFIPNFLLMCKYQIMLCLLKVVISSTALRDEGSHYLKVKLPYVYRNTLPFLKRLVDLNLGVFRTKQWKITAAGGKVLGTPVDIPGIGKYVSFKDSEGNVCSILQPLMRWTKSDLIMKIITCFEQFLVL